MTTHGFSTGRTERLLHTHRPPIPTLYTERLRLVAPDDRHYEAFAELHADAETMRFIGSGRPLDRMESWLMLAMMLGHWDLRGYGAWIVEDLSTGDMAGRAGLFHPKDWSELEVGWMISPSRRGLGYATEAAKAALAYAFEVLGFPTAITLIRPENEVSIRMSEKLGGSLDETIDFMGAPMHVFRYVRS